MVNENQENFEKKKKIIVISLSAVLVFITLIAGLFLVKKNKESSLFLAKKNKESGFENNDIGGVVSKNNNDNKNDGVIVNEGDYFFNKTSGQVTTNVLLFLITGVLFFFWENDKIPLGKPVNIDGVKGCLSVSFCGMDGEAGVGIFEKPNWFGFGTLASFINTTLLVESILHYFIGSIAYFFSKDKNKKYFHTLKMFRKKRKKLFSSFSKTKTFFVVLNYLLYALAIAIYARVVKKINPCCCRPNSNEQIIIDHGDSCCCGYWTNMSTEKN